MIKVMLVDDLPYARMGYRMMLSRTQSCSIIAEADNGRDAIDTIREREHNHQALPNVILMDVRMPVMDGIDATRRITKCWSSIKVLILTTYDEDDYAFGGLEAGASGFLLKDASVSVLIKAIEAMAAGDAVLTPRITRQVLERGVPHPTTETKRHELRQMFDTLTPHQREICALIAEGMNNNEIADQISLESASVRRAISRILTKLNLRDRTQIAVNWYKAGI